MDFLSTPNITVSKVLQNVDLAGSFESILKPAVPITVIGKPVLSGTGFEGFIPAFGPGELVLESGHLSQGP